MLSAQTDQRVPGYLGRALSLELSAVVLYTTQARLVSTWGLAEAASKLQQEAQEEHKHVERIIERMLALGLAPNASQLRPVKLGRSLNELLEVNMSFEQELITLYRDAVRHCARTGSLDDRMLFEALLAEEQGHWDELVAWRQSLESSSSRAERRN